MKAEYIDIESELIKGGNKPIKNALKLIKELPKDDVMGLYVYLKNRHGGKVEGWLIMLLSEYGRS